MIGGLDARAGDDAPLAAFPARLLLIGCGAMAGAMLDRWLDTGLDPARVAVVRPSGRTVAPGIAVARTLAEVAASAPGFAADGSPLLILAAVKPQSWPEVAPMLDAFVADRSVAGSSDATLLSILAGLDGAALAASVPALAAGQEGGGGIVRAMPNTPVRLGQGVVTLCATGVGNARRALVDALMAPLGLVHWLDDDAAFDRWTALAGSGPAFLFRFADALARAGAGLGLPAADAARVARQTVGGAAALMLASDDPPARLADTVASRGGMTRAGLDVLDADGALEALLRRTLRATTDRAAVLAALARGED